ncbi:MSC_0621 family F1-like ATPase epsilon subunit [[Mycoplasma] collis]|uniref:MSC_0621 family F1-like ATPase epsilon subunit n=1 Tax=[Mycoplasma] collis TaxID=2127 RepID=UPI00051AD842|nr:hypothetical protein [[Mycoplasma] collis]
MNNKKNILSKIIIYFANNEKKVFWNSELFLYNNEELKWFNLNNTSLASFDYIFINIVDSKLNKKNYIFLEKCDLINENNEVIIFNSSIKNNYSEVNNYTNKKDLIKTLKKELNYLLLLNKLENSIDNLIKMENIKSQIYLYEVSNYLKIERMK